MFYADFPVFAVFKDEPHKLRSAPLSYFDQSEHKNWT